MTLEEGLLRAIILQHGPIPSVRVSSAQAQGFAKKFSYWGAVRYRIKISNDNKLINTAVERASSDRRSMRLAYQDAIRLSVNEKRVMIQVIGELNDIDIMEVIKQWQKHQEQ